MLTTLPLLLALLAFGVVAWGWAQGGGSIVLPWAPTWRLFLSFTQDGLATLYALLATGIGAAVIAYAGAYLPHHLEEEELPPRAGYSFYALLLLFMGAMVGLVMAQDLLLLFLFWDLTAISSYFLIGFDSRHHSSRRAALMALLVTGVSAVALLVAALLLFALYGTFQLPELRALAEPSPLLTTAGALIAVAALAKSAQVPLHFWLPRAMAAPTPVSAYLHSAAMVAAGVFLLQRTYPLLRLAGPLLDALLLIGLLSMAVGGVLALVVPGIKALLAYSTIAQYGYVVTMLGLGGEYGVAGALFYVLAHALVKSALFMTAGAVMQATGAKKLDEVGGLLRHAPALAVGSGLAAAGLAALPLTIGFWKDELFFEAALHRGLPFAILAVVGAAMTLAYIWRFWSTIFLGKMKGHPHPVATGLWVPVLLLGLLALLGGLLPGPFAQLPESAGKVVYGQETPIKLAYHLDARPVNLLALATYGLGALIVLSQGLWQGAAKRVMTLGEQWGPERIYEGALRGMNDLSGRLQRRPARKLGTRLSTILVPAALLLALGLWVTPRTGTFVVGEIVPGEWLLVALLLVLIVSTGLTVIPRHQLTLVLALAGVGVVLTAVYAVMGAPDVALVSILVGTLSTFLFVGILALFPQHELLKEMIQQPRQRSARWRDVLVSVGAMISSFVITWGTLSEPGSPENMAVRHIRLTPDAHGKDVVTVILADFRGFDTMGEVTVVTIVLLGIVTLLMRQRQ